MAATKAPSMKDVGRVAGVSHQTVSRVLNTPDLVAPATRAKVEAAIAELGFTQNLAARALATNSSLLIGILTPRDALFGPVSTTTSITDAAREAGFATTQVAVPEDPKEIAAIVLQLRRLRVDSLVILRSTDELEAATRPLLGSFRVSTITGGALEDGLVGVQIGHREAARNVTQHLLDLGCRRVAHIAGPSNWYDARERALGWREALESRPFCPLVKAESWGVDEGYLAARSLLESPDRPDAIFAANDMVALGTFRAARDLGLRVPQDLAVAGFDDIACSAHLSAPLTTVAQPFDEAGRISVEQLLALMRGESLHPETLVPQLIERESSLGFQPSD